MYLSLSFIDFHFFSLLLPLNDAFEGQFSGFPLFTLSETLIACGTMHLRYLILETLLNNAFIKLKSLLFFIRSAIVMTM